MSRSKSTGVTKKTKQNKTIQSFIPFIFILVLLITRDLTENKTESLTLDDFRLWCGRPIRKPINFKTLCGINVYSQDVK